MNFSAKKSGAWAPGAKVALVQGGMGGEREVSLSTGRAFETALRELEIDYVVVDAQEDFPERMAHLRPDVALLALHGKYAEDGVVQGVLEYLKIPYTGSGLLTSAICMNKITTKQILRQNQIPTPDFEVIDTHRLPVRADAVRVLRPPCVVKPSREGSSLGVSIVKNAVELEPALRLAAQYDHLLLVESFVDGMEVTVPMLQNRALTPIEIVPRSGFYDYHSKYTAGQTDYYLPARLEPVAIDHLKDIAGRVTTALDIRTYCRVDFRLSSAGDPFVIEVNTLPGCTPTSLLPKSAAKDGIEFKNLVKILLEEATLDYADLK
jgi:D-alanine-D-alanine ligase